MGLGFPTDLLNILSRHITSNRARQLYNNISMLFLFPVKDGKLSTGVNATFNTSCCGYLQQSKITLQNNCINNTSTKI